MTTTARRPARRAQRIDWDKTLERAHRQYPTSAEADWAPSGALRDYEMLGRLVGELLRVESTPQNRRGQRPVLTDDDKVRLRQLLGDDYTTLDFPEAFSSLAGTLSRTQVAERTGVPRTHAHRLLTGAAAPSADDMEAIAAAFGKAPTFFAEYRKGLIMSVIERHLQASPEASVGFVKQLQRR